MRRNYHHWIPTRWAGRRTQLAVAVLCCILSLIACSQPPRKTPKPPRPSAHCPRRQIMEQPTRGNIPLDSLSYDSLQQLLRFYKRNGKIPEALNTSTLLLARQQLEQDSTSLLTMYLEVAALFDQLTAHSLSATYYSRALPLIDIKGREDSMLYARVVSSVARAYLLARLPDSANRYRGILHGLQNGGENLYSTFLYTSLESLACMERQEWATADSLISVALDINRRVQIPGARLQLLLRSALSQVKQAHTGRLNARLREVKPYLTRECCTDDSIRYEMLRVWSLYMDGRRTEALHHSQRVMETTRQLGNIQLTMEALQIKEQLFRIRAMFDSLTRCIATQNTLSDSITGVLYTLDFLLADQKVYQKQVQLEQKLWQQEQKEERALENKGRTLTFVLLSTVLIFFMVLSFILIKHYLKGLRLNRHQKEIEQQVKVANGDLESMILEIVEAQEENYQRGEELRTAQEELEMHINLLMHSMEYAYTLQRAILPQAHHEREFEPDFFLILRPREVVSADLPFLEMVGNRMFYALVDCAQQGVAGASLTFIVYMKLMQLIAERKLTDPAEIIEQFYQGLTEVLSHTDAEFMRNIQINIGLLVLDQQSRSAHYASVNQTLYYHHAGGPITVIKERKQPRPDTPARLVHPGVTHLELKDCTTFYLCSNGVFSQPNADGDPLAEDDFCHYLEEISETPFLQQERLILNHLTQHRMGMEQVDDISLMAMRVQCKGGENSPSQS